MAVLGIKPDLTDIENVRHLVTKVNDAERQLMLPLNNVLQDFPNLTTPKPVEEIERAAAD